MRIRYAAGGMALLLLLLLPGCRKKEKPRDPRLSWQAFSFIGDQGFLQNATPEQLCGAYRGTARFVACQSAAPADGEYACAGAVAGNRLTISVSFPGETMRFDIPPFGLRNGILTAPKNAPLLEEAQSLICAVKTYPSGHMLDGILNMQQEGVPRALHFKLIWEQP